MYVDDLLAVSVCLYFRNVQFFIEFCTLFLADTQINNALLNGSLVESISISSK